MLNVCVISFFVVNINRVSPRVVRLNTTTWIELSSVKVTWHPGHLGSENQTVTIQLARFSMNDGHVYFHSMFPLIAEQNNTGEGQFTVPKGQGQG